MVRVTYSGHFINGKQYLELAGLSTDQKPITGLLTGSLFHELDTKTIYAFSEDASEGEEWIEQVVLSESEESTSSSGGLGFGFGSGGVNENEDPQDGGEE